MTVQPFVIRMRVTPVADSLFLGEDFLTGRMPGSVRTGVEGLISDVGNFMYALRLRDSDFLPVSDLR